MYPLSIQLFVLYGNKAGNNVWGHNVPAVDQILPDAQYEQRAAFINAKYCSGLYRKAHPLTCSQELLNQVGLRVSLKLFYKC